MATLGVSKHSYQMRLGKATNDQREKQSKAAVGKGNTLRTPQTHAYPLVKITEQENENESEERKKRATMPHTKSFRRKVVVKDDASSSEEDTEDDSSSSSGSTSSSESESECDSYSDESDRDENQWRNDWPADKLTRRRSNQSDCGGSRVQREQEVRRLSDIDGGDLRRAGEYGQQLLQLLDKESRRAEILSDLLEREQRRNAELVDKHSDLVKLQRRANCQNQSLKHLEQHSQELELSLKEMKNMLAREKQMKHSMKLEVSRLKKAMNDMEVQAEADQVNHEKTAKKKPVKSKEPSIHKPQSNQLDTTPSPLKFRVGVATPPDSEGSTSKKKQVVQSEQHRQKAEKQKMPHKKPSKVKAAAERVAMTSEFTEVKQMYEDERERRRQLQQEIQELTDSLQNKKMKGPSLEMDLAVGQLAIELKSAKGSRRATIGPCQEVKLLETPPSCAMKQKNPNRKHPRGNLETSFLESVAEEESQEVARDGLSLGETKVKVTCQVNGEEGYTSYLIELWTGEKNNGRIIETRYSKFRGIYEWVKQHSRGGLLSLPTKIPRTSMIDSSSTSKKNIRRRRRWLESTLRSVHYEQHHLLEPLLDHIARLNSNL